MLNELKRKFKIKDVDTGVAGWKDKRAVTRQWVSIPAESFDEQVLSQLKDIKVLEYKNHDTKLRTGKLKGNKFTIVIRDVNSDAINSAKNTLSLLSEHGLPNFYGEQRFGIDKKNAEKGKELLLNPKIRMQPRMKRMLISSYASYLFNSYLEKRIQKGIMTKLIFGDVAKKHDTGGVFIVDDYEKENKRAEKFEISPTGPIFGKKMTVPKDDAKKMEDELLKKEKLERDDFNSQTGTRRFLRIPLSDVKIENMEKSIKLNFFLPRGSYATVLLGEIMKSS